jgi:1-deoxy-D-xylulose-5-phosphate synthase
MSEGFSDTPLLDTVDSPADLKSLTYTELETLADEVRKKIISVAATNEGHLAPHLGVVDLTIALHHVFDTKRNPVIWDVGHQCYAHKLLTGRRDSIQNIRKKGGPSGYPKRSESEYDFFGVGHSSTSISAALGAAAAGALQGEHCRPVAIIGDGAMTAGMAFEALAHAGHLGSNLIVILNDNKMSISPNVGALSSYLNRLITGGLYNRAKGDMRGFMEKALGENVTKAAVRLESSVKGFLTPGTIFEEFGFRYIGPIDGHCLPTLVDCLDNLKQIEGPVFFHCVTQKGKGYTPAEKDPLKYHGVTKFDIETGKFVASSGGEQKKKVRKFTDAFADAFIDATRKDERVVGITAAMPTGTGLSKVEEQFPDRVFDVGICEQHAVTFAAGLAAKGLRPICALYSTFLQRGYDQYIHDVCLQDLPVVFAVDRAGAVGEDSPTQQGAFDLSFLRVIPKATVIAPRDDIDTELMLHWALEQPGPVAVRYARGAAPTIGTEEGRDITKGEILREGTDATLLALGPVVQTCIDAAEKLSEEGLSVGVADARWVKPVDAELLEQICGKPIITVEENSIVGGFGSAVMDHFERLGRLHELKIRKLGFPDDFIDHATRPEQLEEIGLDLDSICDEVRVFVGAAKSDSVQRAS